MQYITESSHLKTQDLSYEVEKNLVNGMKLLFSIEEDVIQPFNAFELKVKGALLQEYQMVIEKDSNIILVGSGSSGRVSYILSHFFKNKNIKGYIAGGESAMIHPQESFEDSEEEGKKFTRTHCEQGDLLFLISASGLAKFNYGAALEAHKLSIKTYYFYNNDPEPLYLKELIDSNIVNPLKYASGAQAITGSTRLQAANLALLCFASLFTGDKVYSDSLQENLDKLSVILFENPSFLKLYQEIEKCFLSGGFVTYITDDELFPIIFSDISELSPTFGENVCSSIVSDAEDAKIRAYTIGGFNIPNYQMQINDKVRKNRPGIFIDITRKDHRIIFSSDNCTFVLDDNKIGFFDIYNLKIILNLISNILMIRAGKIYGNLMIYVKPSNIKLKKRIIRMLEQLLDKEKHPEIESMLEDIYDENNMDVSPIPKILSKTKSNL